MKTLKHWCAVVSMLLVSALAVMAQQPTRQDEFIPISELPPQEQVPAAPLLIGAYMFVLAVLFVYVFSVARRLRSVQQEVDRLDSTLKKSGNA